MQAMRAFFQRRQWAASLLLLAVLALRAVVPAGTMPAAGDDGRIVLLLCNADAGRTILFDPGTGDSRNDFAADTQPCVFAGSFAAFGGPVPVLPAVAFFTLLLPAGWSKTSPAAITAAWRLPPAHAPPAIA